MGPHILGFKCCAQVYKTEQEETKCSTQLCHGDISQ